ncbi:hypothetical protein ACWFPY_17245 [Nocardia fluminea]
MSADECRERMVRAAAERDRLNFVNEVLFDMQESAWESMERSDFASTTAEFDKVAHVDGVRPSVHTEFAEASKQWHAAGAEFEAAANDKPERDQPRLAPQRRVVVERRPQSRGIERSR